jgi:hypothetical protein
MLDVVHWKHMLKNVKHIIFIFNGDQKSAVVCHLVFVYKLFSFIFLKQNIVHHKIRFIPNVLLYVHEHVIILHQQLLHVIHRILNVLRDVFVQMKLFMIVFKINVYHLNNVLVNTIIFNINLVIK